MGYFKMKIYLVTYIEDRTIEGFVKNKSGFTKWLSNHNKQRKSDGELIEYAHEFELKEVNSL